MFPPHLGLSLQTIRLVGWCEGTSLQIEQVYEIWQVDFAFAALSSSRMLTSRVQSFPRTFYFFPDSN